MNKADKIYIAGHRGLVGSAIIRELLGKGYTDIITAGHTTPDPQLKTEDFRLTTYGSKLDLTNQAEVHTFFQKEQPDYVILAAAKVGGIHANNTYPADFIYQNIMIEANVINSAYKNNVKRLLFLGSTCIYPKSAIQPMREDALLTNVLEPTNEPYAIAKIAGIKLCESYNRQYGTDFRSVMPTNLYGDGDNFNLENSHVIPAVMRKLHLAKCVNENNWEAIRLDIDKYPVKGIDSNSAQNVIIKTLSKYGILINPISSVKIWGSGAPRREFLHTSDMAAASLFVLELDEQNYRANTKPMLSHINVGTGKDVTIREAAETMKEVVGFEGKLTFDITKPDGVLKKLIDTSSLSNMGWEYSVDLREGLKKTYKWYLSQLES